MSSRYILLTAAKNEGAYIGNAISSVVNQSILPRAWHIINDGSTDETASIIENYAKPYPFIITHQIPPGMKRDFGAQYRAIQEAYDYARTSDFDFVGIMDADITPKSFTYFESILNAFNADPQLGITGGMIYERNGLTWKPRKSNSPDSVAGGIQMFRRACFDQIGGYKPLRYGGSDWLAQLEARARHWSVHANPDLPVFHYRPSSTADGKWRGLFRAGMMDASFGSIPLFELLKCARRCRIPPYIAGSAVRLSGFFWWKLWIRETVIPTETASFLKMDQTHKLQSLFGFTSKQARSLGPAVLPTTRHSP